MDWIEVGISALIGGVVGGGVHGLMFLVLKNHPKRDERLKRLSPIFVVVTIVALNAGLAKKIRSLTSPTYRAQAILGEHVKGVFELPETLRQHARHRSSGLHPLAARREAPRTQ